jgi:3-mercaptopyruvate sulfurtransferase SseA
VRKKKESSMLCTREWLHDHLGDAKLRIFDCSVEMRPQPVGKSLLISGRDNWAKACRPPPVSSR